MNPPTLPLAPSADQQFDDVISAFASYSNRPMAPTYEEIKAQQRAAKLANPLHVKAVARRRKRKRGGPK